jgi:hypothetical protein
MELAVSSLQNKVDRNISLKYLLERWESTISRGEIPKTRKRIYIMKRTIKNNQFFGNGLTITDCKVWLNNSDEAPEGRDYRIATISINLNDSFWVNNIKVFEKSDDPGVWYIKLPGSFLKTKKNPEGKQFDHVRMTQEQFATLRNYCYDRVDEAQKDASTESDPETSDRD